MWGYDYLFWQNTQVWQTDRRTGGHCMTASSALMHSIAWQKPLPLGLLNEPSFSTSSIFQFFIFVFFYFWQPCSLIPNFPLLHFHVLHFQRHSLYAVQRRIVHCAECPADFTYNSSVNGCYKVVTRLLEWSAAGLACRSLHKDAHLLVINDAAEQSAVAAMLSSTCGQCTITDFVFWRIIYLTWGIKPRLPRQNVRQRRQFTSHIQ